MIQITVQAELAKCQHLMCKTYIVQHPFWELRHMYCERCWNRMMGRADTRVR